MDMIFTLGPTPHSEHLCVIGEEEASVRTQLRADIAGGAISGDMLHAQEKSFQRGVSHGKWLLKAQFDNAASLQMRVKHLEYVVGHYERWVRELKTQLGEREPFSSNSNFPLDP
jgi:hypothetical protein